MKSIKLMWVTAIAFVVVPVLMVVATPSAQTQTFKVIHTFRGGKDGEVPYAGLVRDAAGNLYGTTTGGGASNLGTVFKLDATGKETVLHSFTGGADGAVPYAGLVRDASGNIYGTTIGGGASNAGTVFKLDATGKETVLHSFTGGADGASPHARLVRDAAGNLYGTTFRGGAFDNGTVFRLHTTGKETVLHSFGPFSGNDGIWPNAGLVLDGAGNLYGTTLKGSSRRCLLGCGTVFEVFPSGGETVLYSFTAGVDGAIPLAALVRDAAGNLYGTTGDSGAFSHGTVFKVDATGKETVLHSFTGGADGAAPYAGLVRDAAGNLYGTTIGGGASNLGTVFKLDATSKETVLHSFTGGADGAVPYAGLVRDALGNFYGTTSAGGTSNWGTVFQLGP